MKNKLILFCILSSLLFWSCTFDYGNKESEGDALPDLVMENVEYIRVRSADLLARIQADRFERYEKQDIMKVQNIVFEQYSEKGEEVNVHGRAGSAVVHIESADIFMDNYVSLEVITEDIILESYQLEWKDAARTISSGEEEPVNIFRENGTWFTGIGLEGNTRTRTWEFLGSVDGVYIHDDDEEEE